MKRATSSNPYLNAMVSVQAYNPVDDGFFENRINTNGVAITKRSLHSRLVKENPGSGIADDVEHLSYRELLAIIDHIEDAVARGAAQIQDYEAFILCKGELVRREQRQAAPALR